MAIVAKKVEVEDHMESTLEVLSNAVRAIGSKLDRLSQKFDSHDEKIGAIVNRFDQVDERFELVDKRFDQVDERFELVDRRLDQVDKRLELVDKRLDQVDRRFDRLERALDHLDSKIETLGAQLGSAIRSMSERVDRQWDSLNAHQREMKIMIEKATRGWLLIAMVLLGSLAVVGIWLGVLGGSRADSSVALPATAK